MRSIKYILVFVMFQIICSDAFSAIGCLGGGVLYTNMTASNGLAGGKIWDTQAPYPISTTACPRVELGEPPTGSTVCSHGLLGLFGGSLINYNTFTPPVGCPIDDFVPFLFLAGVGLACYRLRRVVIQPISKEYP